MYRRFLLNKHPMMTFRNYESLSRHLETLKRKSVPSALPSFQSFMGRETGNTDSRDSELV